MTINSSQFIPVNTKVNGINVQIVIQVEMIMQFFHALPATNIIKQIWMMNTKKLMDMFMKVMHVTHAIPTGVKMGVSVILFYSR